MGFVEIIHHEGLIAGLSRLRLHVISAGNELSSLGASSKLNAEEEFLRHLSTQAGRVELARRPRQERGQKGDVVTATALGRKP